MNLGRKRLSNIVKKNGKFSSPSDIKKVKGIGNIIYSNNAHNIKTSGKTMVDTGKFSSARDKAKTKAKSKGKYKFVKDKVKNKIKKSNR